MDKGRKLGILLALVVAVVLAGWYCKVKLSSRSTQGGAQQTQQAYRETLSSVRKEMGESLFLKPVVLALGKTLKESFEDLGKQAGVTVEFTGPPDARNTQLNYTGPFGAAMVNLALNNGYEIVKKSEGVYQVAPKK